MSASKVLDLAQQQGLLDEQVADELRREVAGSKFEITAEAIAKVLVDQGHLTQFQAGKLIAAAKSTTDQPVAPAPSAPTPSASVPPAPAAPVEPNPPAKKPSAPVEDLWLADEPPPQPASPAPQASGSSGATNPRSVTQPIDQFADEDDDVVMLEAVEPTAPETPPQRAPRPPRESRWTTAPPAKKPPEPTKPAARKKERYRTEEAAPPRGPAPHAEVDDIPTLTPANVPAAGAPPTLTPLEPVPTLMPLGGDDLLAADPLGAGPMMGAPPPGLSPLGPPPGAPGAAPPGAPERAKKPPRNQWDSPLLMIGGGLFGVLLIAFGILFFALTRGSAKDLFDKAEEEYKSGAYASAMVGYESFLKKYPSDPNASLAKVRLGLAQIRQVSDRGGDPQQSLKIAETVLPTIETEPSFAEARSELASILPDIADAFADRAKEASDTARKEELVAQSEQAMKLVTNPSYIPGSLRKNLENRVATILDKIKAARRGIDQANELATALQKMEAAAKAGQVAEGYEVRHALLRGYPTLMTSEKLATAVRAIADRERELVQVTEPKTAALTDDPQPTGYRVVLAAREGSNAPGVAGQRFFTLVQGAVYALDATTGRVQWRRYVGNETTIPPLALGKQADANVLVSDARAQSLVCLAGDSGKLVWRQPLGEAFFPPILHDGKVLVTTSAGRLLEIDAASGAIARQAQLPQKPTVGPCLDPKRNRVYQLGEHSTIFVFNGDTLQCDETYYLGHSAGAILSPPVVALEHLLVPESPKDDYTLLHVFGASEKGELKEIGDPFRLHGRVAAPVVASGRRVAVVTDLGQVAVYEIDSASDKQPVREVGGVNATEAQPVLFYPATDGRRLWIAGRRASMYEIQGSVQQLSRGWTLHQDDAFIAPLQITGNVLLHVRRRPNAATIYVEACQAADGKTLWVTQLNNPVIAVGASDERAELSAITATGRVFEVPRDSIVAGVLDKPTETPPRGTGVWNLTDVAELSAGRWFCSGFASGGQALLYDVAADSKRAKWLEVPALKNQASGGTVAYQGGVLVGVQSGRVLLIDPESGQEKMLPFQPELMAGSQLQWIPGTALPPDGASAVVSDGQRLFRIGVKDAPQPHLAQQAEGTAPGTITGPLAATGDTLYAVVKGGSGETVTAMRPDTLAAGTNWPLTGGCRLGPAAVQGLVFVADSTSLYAFEPGQKLRWQMALKHGALAGPPMPCEGDFLLLFRSGKVARIAADTGEELAVGDVGEPLARAAWLMGQRVLVAGVDGVLHLVPIPKRS